MLIRPTAAPLQIGNLVVENLRASEAADADFPFSERDTVAAPERLRALLEEFAIVVCTKDEPLPILKGVLEAIPKVCDTVLVSNSLRPEPEIALVDSLRERGRRRRVWHVHQRSTGLAERLAACGLDSLLSEDGEPRVSDGKGEGMVAGTLCAAGLGKSFVGFIDADNHSPKTVVEYLNLFALGMARRGTDRCMVRLRWKGKREVDGRRREWGRASRVSNEIFNQLLEPRTSGIVNPITTGNAGEFALTLKSALDADWTSRFGAESFLLLQFLERNGDGLRDSAASEILQIQTLSDHCHTRKSPEHIARIIHESLLPVYLSPVADASLREKIEPFLLRSADNEEVSNALTYKRYPSIASLGIGRVRTIFCEYLNGGAPVDS